MTVSDAQRHSIFDNRKHFLNQFEDSIWGYRTDMQVLLKQGQDLYPMRPAVHDLISTLYDDMINKVQIGESERRAASQLYKEAKNKIIAYVHKKKECTGTPAQLGKWDAWTKAADKATDAKTIDALLKASDHIEDTLFLAELAAILKLSSSISHVDKELSELRQKLNDYLALIPEETARELREGLSPVLEEVETLNNQENYTQELERIKRISAWGVTN
ncbi:MAG: hypothetical protein LLG04_18655 [Parachlamydia sp.]|nr:hypothetical protein [Parachlamydia sp.]